MPNGTVTRALSIRVGDRDEGTVCFDTANLSLRAGWAGGFLKFDPARFGLLNSPKIDGQIQFVAPEGPGWSGATGRFSGFYAHGKRVVLEYQLGETTVHESPWWEENGAVRCFTRTLEVAPSERELTLLVARLSPLRGDPEHRVVRRRRGRPRRPRLRHLRSQPRGAEEDGEVGERLIAAN